MSRRSCGPYEFATTCVNVRDARLLEGMYDRARKVKYCTARRHLGVLLTLWAEEHGYAPTRRQGLTLKNDYHVRYYTSVFDGKPCFWIAWIAIDHIWTRRETTCIPRSMVLLRSTTTATPPAVA